MKELDSKQSKEIKGRQRIITATPEAGDAYLSGLTMVTIHTKP